MSSKHVNLANLITLARLLSVPLAVWLILSGHLTAAFWLFVAAGISDAVDGFIAKRFHQRTTIGALMDPLADKALLVSVYVTLGIAGHLPNWLVILVVFRDILIVGGFLLLQTTAHAVHAQPLLISKINTALQIALAAVSLANLGLPFDLSWLADVLIVLVAGSTVASGAAYLIRWTRVLAGSEAAE